MRLKLTVVFFYAGLSTAHAHIRCLLLRAHADKSHSMWGRAGLTGESDQFIFYCLPPLFIYSRPSQGVLQPELTQKPVPVRDSRDVEGGALGGNNNNNNNRARCCPVGACPGPCPLAPLHLSSFSRVQPSPAQRRTPMADEDPQQPDPGVGSLPGLLPGLQGAEASALQLRIKNSIW